MFVGSTGCASIAGIGRDVCDTVFGGSKVGGLCEKIDELVTEEPETEEPETDEAPAE
jgi:hypothetical protein